VRDPQLIPYIEQTMDTDNPKHWYNALMDYGAYVKSLGGNPGRKSAHYVKQGRFEGSRRQVRGAVLKLLVNERVMTEQDLRNGLGVKQARLQEVLYQLVEEHILKKEGEDYLIPDENK
jgi:A/G-specific adenine glycosylase